jgi:hypothetical protein
VIRNWGWKLFVDCQAGFGGWVDVWEWILNNHLNHPLTKQFFKSIFCRQNDLSNRYTLQNLLTSNFKLADIAKLPPPQKKNHIFKRWILTDCVEFFRKTGESQLISIFWKILNWGESLQCLQAWKKMSRSSLWKYQLSHLL